MIKIILSTIGAALSGLLLYLGHESIYFFLFAPLCFTLICFIIEYNYTLAGFLYVSFFTFTYLFLQSTFLWDAADKDGFEVFYCIFPFLVYLIPQFILLFLHQYRIICFLITWLLSEYIFYQMELGCPIYQIGNIWGHVPVLIQWYEYTGIFGGSIWIMLIAFALYKAIHYQNYMRLLISIIFPISLGIILYSTQNPKQGCTKTNKVSILSLRQDYDYNEIDSMIYANRYIYTDFIVMPEALFACPENSYQYSSLLTHLRRNLTDSLANTSIVMGLWLYDNNKNLYNVALSYSKKEEHIRYKQLRMPFAEFLPNSTILGYFNFFRQMVVYPLSTKSNPTEILCVNQKTFSPLICYESICLDFLCKLIKNGAQFLTVSASNSSLNSMHMEKTVNNILRASAITLRRDIIRSVDNGIPCFIKENGDIYRIPVNTAQYAIRNVGINDKISFYVNNSKLISNIYLLGLLIFIVFFIIKDRI